jgi:hypothetical protein
VTKRLIQEIGLPEERAKLNGTFSRKLANRCLETFETSPERLWLCLESRSCLKTT